MNNRLALAVILLLTAGLLPAKGQNFPAPGQSIAMPSAPAQQGQAQPQANFPAPGQAFSPPPAATSGGFQTTPGGFPGPGGGAPAAPPSKCQEIMTLHQEREKRGGLIQAAIQRKAPPSEICGLVKSFADSEAKMVKFVVANEKACGFPPDAATNLKASQKRTLQVRSNACAAAAGPPPPRPPTFGEALGTSRIPDASTTRTGRGGAFDTLSGNAITR